MLAASGASSPAEALIRAEQAGSRVASSIASRTERSRARIVAVAIAATIAPMAIAAIANAGMTATLFSAAGSMQSDPPSASERQISAADGVDAPLRAIVFPARSYSVALRIAPAAANASSSDWG